MAQRRMPASTAQKLKDFMKTQSFRVWALGVVGITTIVLGTGCHQQEARAEVPSADQIVPQIVPADPTALNAAGPDDATRFEAPVAPVNLAGAPDLEKTNVSTNVAMPKLVQNPVIPDDLKVSPALEEVLKLAQAGVSQEVMLAYITHSTTFFNVTSDAIVYLNDLGVSNDVITALIQHDSTPGDAGAQADGEFRAAIAEGSRADFTGDERLSAIGHANHGRRSGRHERPPGPGERGSHDCCSTGRAAGERVLFLQFPGALRFMDRRRWIRPLLATHGGGG